MHHTVKRLRLKVGDGARAEIFATNLGDDYTRLEIEVTLGKGAHSPNESLDLTTMTLATKRAALLIYRVSRDGVDAD